MQARHAKPTRTAARSTTGRVIAISGSLLILALLLGAFTGWQWYLAKDRQLSEQPPLRFSEIVLQPVPGTIGLQAQLSYAHLKRAAEHATREPLPGRGRQRSCDRVLGAKLCATVAWQYSIARTGPVGLQQNRDRLRLTLPLRLTGQLSIEGQTARVLGLRNKDISGALELIADIRLDVDSQWCPQIDSHIDYRWLTDPRLRLAGRMKINLRDTADKALRARLPRLQQRLANVISCDKFQQRLQQQWKTHLLPVNIPGQEHTLLKITPLDLAFSGSRAGADHLSFGLSIDAVTETLSSAQAKSLKLPPLALPPRRSLSGEAGAVEFSLLIRSNYAALGKLLTDKLANKPYRGAAGTQFTIQSIELYPSDENLIFKLDFEARSPGTWFDSNGTVFVSGRPVTGADGKSLSFENISLTRVIDGPLWRLLATLLNTEILQTIRRESNLDLSRSLQRIERNIAATLANPEKTAGIDISARGPELSLVAVNVEQHALAAIVHVSTSLQASIPASLLLR